MAEQKQTEQKAPEKPAETQKPAEKSAEQSTQKQAEQKPKPSGYVVSAAAVVLPLEGGSERYLYRGAVVGDGFTKDGIKHALAAGLIKKAE